MIIDFHAHIYPEKISSKATHAISDFYEGAAMAWQGSSAELLKSGVKINVSKYVVHSAATTAGQVESVNNFIIREMEAHPEFIGFGTIHPEYENYEQELERIKAAGIKGIKLHPDFQKFPADTEAMDKIYDKIAELKLPVLFHAGDIRYDYSGPKRIRHVMEKHPDLIVIAAHFGGYTQWDDSLKYLVGTNCYMDTSSTIWKLPLEKCNEILKKHGYDKFLFGSDYPMWDHEEVLAQFNTLDLTPEEKEAVLSGNAIKLFEKLK